MVGGARSVRRMETSGTGEGRTFMGSGRKPRQNREFLELSLRGLGLFALFWLGGKEDVTGSTIFGSCAQDHVIWGSG